jgi:hypothetical protein
MQAWHDVCDHTRSDCMTSPPCVSTGTRIPCDACNRHFRSVSCFEKHKKFRMGSRKNKKTICELKRNCSACSYPIIPKEKHECYKRYCKNCNQNKEVRHLWYMAPLVMDLVQPSNRVLYVFYDFETMQNKRYDEKTTVHMPHLVCVKQFCSQCEGIADIQQDCEQCARRMHRTSSNHICSHSWWWKGSNQIITPSES